MNPDVEASREPNRGARVGLRARVRTRPVLYPVGILVAFILFLLVRTGVSPYAAGRPLLIAVIVGLVLPWLLGLVVADRDRAGILAIVVVMLLLAGQSIAATALLLAVFALVLAEGITSPGRARGIRWSRITRAMSAVTAVILVAVGLAALEGGRLLQVSHDLVAEVPIHLGEPVARAGAGQPPSVYLVMLDGYPRADKLAAELEIDNEPFLQALASRSFIVSRHSRSNHVATDLTLASMFNGALPSGADAGSADYRPAINDGAIIRQFRDGGYEVIAFSSGFEGVTLRQVDRFVDSGQVNEFEWELLQLSGLAPVLDLVMPTFLADQHRARVLATFDGATSLAGEAPDRPRLVLVHVLNPHSPQVFGPAGEPIRVPGIQVPFDDSDELLILGRGEYGRRFAGQLAYVNRRVLSLLAAVISADPEAIVVVFSDHGSGIREFADIGGPSDVDLRTANMLAVRSPGHAGIIDDRSTLVNVLPRILRAILGSGPADVPETIYGPPVDGNPVVFERPD